MMGCSSYFVVVVLILRSLSRQHEVLAFNSFLPLARTRKTILKTQTITDTTRRIERQQAFTQRNSNYDDDDERERKTTLSDTRRKRRNYSKNTTGSSFRIVRCFANLSRREAESAITEGRVKVNGEVIDVPSFRITMGQTLTLDNKIVSWESRARAQKALARSRMNDAINTIDDNLQTTTGSSSHQPFVYYKYHKPLGVTCTMDKNDKRGMYYSLPSELVRTPRRSTKKKGPEQQKQQRLFPVGRLDLDSDGLVLLTNDGQLTDLLLQPKYKHEKEYTVTVHPPLSNEKINQLRNGIVISTMQQRGGKITTSQTKPCTIFIEDEKEEERNNNQRLRFVLCEGRNRQIRKMIEAVHSNVVSLTRIRHGTLLLGNLRNGDIAALTDNELDQLLKSVQKHSPKRYRRRT